MKPAPHGGEPAFPYLILCLLSWLFKAACMPGDLSLGPTDRREVMAILSEAVVTEGKALGISILNSCLEGRTSYQRMRQAMHIARYCLSDSSLHPSNPGTLSRVTDASLSTALQADRRLRQTTLTTGTTVIEKVISVVCVVCHFVTSAVAPVLPVVIVVCVVF